MECHGLIQTQAEIEHCRKLQEDQHAGQDVQAFEAWKRFLAMPGPRPGIQ